MAQRRYTIKETKSPSFAIANFEVSKSLVQASSLGLRPAPPDAAEIETAMKKAGTVVAYELAYDAGQLSFELRIGSKSRSLGSVKIREAFAKRDLRCKVMARLVGYGLVGRDALPATEAEIAAKEQEIEAAQKAEAEAYSPLSAMQYETLMQDLAVDRAKAFKAWIHRSGFGRYLELHDAAERQDYPAAKKYLARGTPNTVKVSAGVLDAIEAALARQAKPDLSALREEVGRTIDTVLLQSYYKAIRKPLQKVHEQRQAETAKLKKQLAALNES